MRVTEHSALTEAISLGSHELVAMVGGGGKTSSLQLLAEEASGRGNQVVATTTTAILLRDLETIGPVVVEPEWPVLKARLDAALVEASRVCAVRSVREDGKAEGLPVAWVDDLWAAGWVSCILVEADGSRGMSLKAFGGEEPQVPSTTTVVVQVAGLDVLGAPLAESHVHRAELLAKAVGVPLGTAITVEILVRALLWQLHSLKGRWPAARLVALLNKAEGKDVRQAGLDMAARLLATSESEDRGAYSGVVVGSVRERVFLCATAGEDG